MITLKPYQERVFDSLRVRDADGPRFIRHRKRGKTTLTSMRLAAIGAQKTLQANSHEAFQDSRTMRALPGYAPVKGLKFDN